MPYPVTGLLEVYEDMVEILLMLKIFLAEDPEIEYLFYGAPSGSETCLLLARGANLPTIVAWKAPITVRSFSFSSSNLILGWVGFLEFLRLV